MTIRQLILGLCLLITIPCHAIRLEIQLPKTGPNPFNPASEVIHFEYYLTDYSDITLTAYSQDGVLITQTNYPLPSSGITGGGINTGLTWDGKDEMGQALPIGIYILHLQATSGSQTAQKFFRVAVIQE